MIGYIMRRLPDARGFALILIATAWLSGILLDSFLRLPSETFLPGSALAIVFLSLLRKDRSGQLIMLLVLCLLLGAWRCGIALPTNDPHAIATYPMNLPLSIRGSVVSEPEQQASGNTRRMQVSVSSVSIGNSGVWQTAHGTIELTTNGLELEDPYGANYGDSIEASGKLQKPDSYSSPGVQASMSFARVSVETSDTSVLSWLYRIRAQLAEIITRSLPQPEAAILVAIVLGLRTPALHPLINIFNATGTAHLIAPSGFKVTVLSGLIAGGTRWMRRPACAQGHQKHKLPRIFAWLARKISTREVSPHPSTARGETPPVGVFLILSSIALYTVLSGAGSAAIRAGIMGALLVLAPRLRRTYNIYTALALAALIMSIFDPFVLWDAGFQLSFLGTLGIVLFTPTLQRFLRPLANLPLGHTIAEMIAVTLAAQIATLPVFASTFHNISFVAPLANTLTVPLLALLIFLGVCTGIAGLCYAPLAQLCGWISWPVLWYVQQVLTWCSQLPGASLAIPVFDGWLAWIYYALLGAGYWLLPAHITAPAEHETLPRPLIGLPRSTFLMLQAGAALLVVLITGLVIALPAARTETTITILSLGSTQQPRGTAQLVQTSDNKTILIDGGADASALAQALDSRLPPWQRSLDAVILTSPRQDHIVGLLDVITRYNVGQVIDAGMLHPDTTYTLWRRSISEREIHYTSLVQGETIPIGKVAVQALWPPAQLHKGSNEVRDNSLAIRLITPELRMLILGETAQSSYALNGLLAQPVSNYFQADIVQITEAEYKAALPALAMIVQQAHPAYLVTTLDVPAQRKHQNSALAAMPPILSASGQAGWQSVETAQMGTVVFHCKIGQNIALN
jgi:competence protein ComEC